MSDVISQLSGFNYSLKDIIKSVIGATFFADYAIVEAVNSDKTINVIHASLNVTLSGEVLPQTKTQHVEVIWPASAGMGIKWELAAGDGVLLVGLRNLVETTANIQAPSAAPTEFYHYNQDTMKAIPLQSVSSPKITIVASSGGDLEIGNTNTGGKIQLKNSVKSLYTVLNNLITHLSSATTIPAAVGTPLTFNPATIANLTQDATDLALLLKA